jgi:hypothetical protein
MPPLVLYAAGVALAGLGLRFLKQEWRRVNDQLDRYEGLKNTPKPDRTLKRDPQSGEWRVK